MRVRHPPARPWRRRVAAGMGMGRKAPVVNSVEVIGLWLSFPNYLARSWPSIISVPELESLCLFYATYGKEPGDLVPPRIHVACPPARGQEGSGRVHGRVPLVG